MGEVVEKRQCPKCAAEGRDNTGDNLVVYADGGAKCYGGGCGYTQPKAGTSTAIKSKSKPKMTIAEVEAFPILHDPDRKVRKEVVELYGVRSSCSEESGKPVKTFYPYTTEGGKPVSYKVRDNANKKKMFNTGKLPGLFGKGACSPATTQRLMITEGEEDTLAAKTILWGVKIDVVSLPNGATLDAATKADLGFIEQYKEVYICTDADAPGLDVSKELADWLSGAVQVKVLGLDPDVGKDAGDYLVAGQDNAFKMCIKNAQKFEPDGIVNGQDINIDDLLKKMPEGYVIPFDGMNDKLHGIRKAEIITVCAGSGIGKTTLVREIAKALIELGLSVANVALEDQMEVAAQALLALDMDIPLPQFRVNPPSKSDIQTSYDKLIANGKTFFYKHFGGLNVDTLMPKLYHYARSSGVDFIILDHLSMVVSGSASSNERKDIDTLMHKLAQMVVETGVGLIQIVHLKRTSGDKSFAKGGEVELTDLRGSAALEQLSWAVVGMERDQQGDDTNAVSVRILKNRTWGFTGLCDSLTYVPETGRLITAVAPPPELGDSDALGI